MRLWLYSQVSRLVKSSKGSGWNSGAKNDGDGSSVFMLTSAAVMVSVLLSAVLGSGTEMGRPATLSML